jgi:hypothetical protein
MAAMDSVGAGKVGTVVNGLAVLVVGWLYWGGITFSAWRISSSRPSCRCGWRCAPGLQGVRGGVHDRLRLGPLPNGPRREAPAVNQRVASRIEAIQGVSP